MKVLHVLNSNRFSGAENVVCQIIEMFKEDGIQMAYTSPDGQIRHALEERGITFFPLKKLKHSELKKVVEQFQPDIIHGHDIRGGIQSSLFFNKARIIHTVHVNDMRMRRVTMKSVLYFFASLGARHIFWVSKSCLEQYVMYKFVSKKSTVLYNVIDEKSTVLKSVSDKNSYNFDVVYIGRLTPQKNPKRLIEVLKLVVNKRESVRIAIVGTGDEEDTVKEMVEKYQLNKNIQLLGYMSNPLKLLASSKVMIMTSDWEGTPMVSLEAMTLGIPIVSTPTDGMCEILENGVNGYLENDNDKLAERIVELISDEELWKLMSSNQVQKSHLINDIMSYKQKIYNEYI